MEYRITGQGVGNIKREIYKIPRNLDYRIENREGKERKRKKKKRWMKGKRSNIPRHINGDSCLII